jgi:glycosyltransferase involved in cell wall biosynthesis
VRSEFGISADAPVLVSAARLFRYKGQHDLLAALPAVKDRFPEVRVLIVGQDDPRGFQGDQSYSDVLRGMCTELDLWDNVVFAGWRTDVKELMAASDLYVMPSFEEPFGMVFIESMYLRRPVIALDNGGTREVVDNGGSGLLSEPGDVEAISGNIVRLLEDRDLRVQMGEHGRRRVVELLNAERMTRDVERVYDSIAG